MRLKLLIIVDLNNGDRYGCLNRQCSCVHVSLRQVENRICEQVRHTFSDIAHYTLKGPVV